MVKLRVYTTLLPLLIALAAGAQTGEQASSTKSQIPFVGCKSDGQVGPHNAPKGNPKLLHLPARYASLLAYYKAEQGLGILAPRGWHCFSTYGSSGVTLFVAPQPLNAELLFSTSWKGFTGPVIQISISDGDTSGRFSVAKAVARVFPAHKSFVSNVIREGIEPADNFPSGPYPKDKLVYRDDETVEYETPANSKGFGTDSRLRAASEPIRGALILVGNPISLLSLSIRLSAEDHGLSSIIIRQTESDAISFKP